MSQGDTVPQPDDDGSPPSLWRELADGSAGPVVKAFVCLALAPLLAGVALLLSYLFAMWGWESRYYSAPGYPYPGEELLAVLMVSAGLAYLAAVAWVWTRNRPRQRPLWRAALLTVGIGAVTAVACAFIEDGALGDDIVIGGVLCVASSAVVWTWIQAARRYGRGVPMRDRTDGALDVRCPSCGYRMVGLHESRCPECGTGYTLDELLGRQHFISGAHRQARRACRPTGVPHDAAPAATRPGAGGRVGGSRRGLMPARTGGR